MNKDYTSGVAFIFEGETEQIFYETLLSHLSGKYPEYSYSEVFDYTTSEFVASSKSKDVAVIIRKLTMKTITQIPQSHQWFHNVCRKKYPELNWTIFLCYDTDSYESDISRFYEGDWALLRTKLKSRNVTIVDLCIRAMIEDLFLLDPEGIFTYLNAPSQKIQQKGNGKTILKNLFRQHRKTYHTGERAHGLISCLDMDLIIEKSDVSLPRIEECCFPPLS